jgi:hypothetical protein
MGAEPAEVAGRTFASGELEEDLAALVAALEAVRPRLLVPLSLMSISSESCRQRRGRSDERHS